MHDVIQNFSDLVVEHTILMDYITNDGIHRFKAKLKLKNNTELDVYERLKGLDRNYSYNWRKWNNTLIIRWDNAKHHPKLENYPHHKHITTNENVNSSDEMTLEKVLKYISGSLLLLLIVLVVMYFQWF